MGCHSDSGYAMESQGFESQMVYGESFEFGPAVDVVDPRTPVHANISWDYFTDGVADFKLDNATQFHGLASQRLALRSGTTATIINRGLRREGLVFHGGTARSVDDARATSIASTVVTVASRDWEMYTYTFTPSASTKCAFIPF
eukprot:gene20003-14517_t